MMKRIYALLTMTLLVLSAYVPLAFAVDVNPGLMADPTYPIQWMPNGEIVAASMLTNPEYLKVRTETHVSHNTRLTILGLDTNGQPVSGIAVNLWQLNLPVIYSPDTPSTWVIPASTPPEYYFPVVDVHSGKPVTFAKITAIYQQGGEVCNSFKVETMRDPVVVPSGSTYPKIPSTYQEFLGVYHVGPGFVPYLVDGYPREPSNPEPIKIIINWYDDGDYIPEPAPFDEITGAQSPSTLRVKGFDQNGNMVEFNITVAIGQGTLANPVVLPGIWSDVCFIDGGAVGDTYNIFTHPAIQRQILTFKNKITSIGIKINPVNILANGVSTATITVSWYDQDMHTLHWSVIAPNMTVNVVASGGKVAPSIITVPGCNEDTTTKITSDTSARIIKVSALAHLPAFPGHAEQQLTAVALMGFDGVSSSQTWGTHWEPLGGPNMMALIKLNPGPNLISIPIFGEAILASQLSKTSATTNLIKICTYTNGTWLTYVFADGSGTDFPIVQGYGYWIFAEKPCTLYYSGTWYGPCTFVPPENYLIESWNLMGVTSAWGIPLGEYLASLGPSWSGFAWLYNNDLHSWFRIGPNDAVWPGQAFWVTQTGNFIAP